MAVSNSAGRAPLSVECGSTIRPGRFIVRASDTFYDECGVAQGDADGVSGSKGVLGEAIPMNLLDGQIVKVEAGAAVTHLADVATDNQGRAIAHVSGVGNRILGKALEAAGAAGEWIRVQAFKERDQVA